jgi:hypothetical protein
MNSDFVQIEAEQLAKRVATEPNNRARVKKLYNLAYGRDPNEEEIQIALDYLHTEPMKEYEEGKAKPKKRMAAVAVAAKVDRAQRWPAGGDAAPATGGAITETAKPAPEATIVAGAAPAADANAGMGMGLMGGMGGFAGGGGGGFGGGGGRGRGAARPVEVKYEPTAWGRYAKVLLSSTEFTFIN